MLRFNKPTLARLIKHSMCFKIQQNLDSKFDIRGIYINQFITFINVLLR